MSLMRSVLVVSAVLIPAACGGKAGGSGSSESCASTLPEGTYAIQVMPSSSSPSNCPPLSESMTATVPQTGGFTDFVGSFNTGFMDGLGSGASCTSNINGCTDTLSCTDTEDGVSVQISGDLVAEDDGITGTLTLAASGVSCTYDVSITMP
jgi:hypothetical protein